MCSQTMMSSTETRQGFKVTKAFLPSLFNSASGFVREQHLSSQGWRGKKEDRLHYIIRVILAHTEQESVSRRSTHVY